MGDTVNVGLWGVASEKVNLQLGIAHGHGVVLLGKFSTELVNGFIRAILHGGEETIEVITLGIEVDTFLSFGLDVNRPTVVVILHHLHIVNGDLSVLTKGIGELGGLLLIADGGVFYLFASLCLGNDFEGGVDINGDTVQITGALLHGFRPLGYEGLALRSESGGHAHLLHLDGRGEFYDQSLTVEGVLLGGFTAWEFHALTSETLLVTSGGNDLTEVFLHIVFVALKSLLVGDIDTILGRIVVGNAGAVTTDRNEVVTDLFEEVVNLDAVILVIHRLGFSVLQTAVLLDQGCIVILLDGGHGGLVNIE